MTKLTKAGWLLGVLTILSIVGLYRHHKNSEDNVGWHCASNK